MILDKAYRSERDARVRERILLITRVSPDKQHIESVAKELHRARSWAYKWHKRYRDEGGWKDQETGKEMEDLQPCQKRKWIKQGRNCQMATQDGILDR